MVTEVRPGSHPTTGNHPVTLNPATPPEKRFRSRVEKFSRRFCNTRYGNLQFDGAPLEVISLILLRGRPRLN
jgi:hypothetical protein